MLTSAIRTAVLVAALAVPAAASAQIYNNGLPNSLSGNEMTGFIQAQDFTLSHPYLVSGIRFWGFATTPTAYQGSVAWQIYGNNAGMPDQANILFSGLSVITPTNEGAVSFGGYDRLRFDLATNFTLGAGTYWLGLHNGDYGVNTIQGLAWETTNANGTATGLFDAAPFGVGAWQPNTREHAFQLEGTLVPEPSVPVLMIVGLAGIVLVRRREA